MKKIKLAWPELFNGFGPRQPRFSAVDSGLSSQRGGLVPIGEALADLHGPVKALREATPQAVHHFTCFDQVNQLVSASEADPGAAPTLRYGPAGDSAPFRYGSDGW